MVKLYELVVYDANCRAVFFEVYADRHEATEQARLLNDGYIATVEVVEIVDVYDTDALCFSVVLSNGTVLSSLSDYSPDGEYYDDVPEDCFNNADYVADLLEQVKIQLSAFHASGLDMQDVYDDYDMFFKH